MNTVSQVLITEATMLRESTPELVAVGILKQAGVEDHEARVVVAQDAMEKRALYELTYKGLDAEDALKLIKSANIDVTSLPGVTLDTNEERLASVLEKAANFIEEQASYIEQLEKAALESPRVVEKVVEVSVEKQEMPSSLSKMASVGNFSFEDLEALRSMPEDTLNKVASVMEEPWQLGKAAGVSRPVTDPLLEFILG